MSCINFSGLSFPYPCLFLSESGISELEDDEAFVDEAVKMGAMHFLRQSVVASQHFHQEVHVYIAGINTELLSAGSFRVYTLAYSKEGESASGGVGGVRVYT